MIIGQIKEGIVIDHITAGRGMEIYKILHLDEKECVVAMIKNADSKKMEKKDIIKIGEIIDLNLDVLGYIDPGITVNIIKDGKLFKRERLKLPERVFDVIKCKNPRCITSTERELRQEFRLTDPEKRTYCCAYCDAFAK
ncbi:MAG: aspartate carbamoyltransferase regulatory subunit [Clostridia bacterium]|nr:aspartate carbamoyltransferase regulatory subunit [Clostridia bacterium]